MASGCPRRQKNSASLERVPPPTPPRRESHVAPSRELWLRQIRRWQARLPGGARLGSPARILDELPKRYPFLNRKTKDALEVFRSRSFIGHLISNHEEISLLATLLVAIDRRHTRGKVQRQLVRLLHTAAAAAFQNKLPQVLVDPIVRLKLRNLEWHSVARSVSHTTH